MREYLRELLPRLGHEVMVAEGGRQLVELCRAFPPDLVITDIKMPDMDGIEAVEEVNREREVPVILVSAHHDAEPARAGHARPRHGLPGQAGQAGRPGGGHRPGAGSASGTSRRCARRRPTCARRWRTASSSSGPRGWSWSASAWARRRRSAACAGSPATEPQAGRGGPAGRRGRRGLPPHVLTFPGSPPELLKGGTGVPPVWGK